MEHHIAICDDEAVETEYLAALVRDWAAYMGRQVSVTTFDSAEAFLFDYSAHSAIDILLLDIKMKQIDGITLAKNIRERNEKMQIVFATGIPDYIAEGYEVSALHYLMKPVVKDKLFDVLDKAHKLLTINDTAIVLETDEGNTRVYHSDIWFAEADAHNASVHTSLGVVSTRTALNTLYQQLITPGAELSADTSDINNSYQSDSQFCRPHRSYIVNLKYIKKITKTDITLDDGTLIPLSRRRYNEINRAFIRYYSR